MIANEFIQCRKVCEYVSTNIINAANNNQTDGNSEGLQMPPEERIELLCNDVVCI